MYTYRSFLWGLLSMFYVINLGENVWLKPQKYVHSILILQFIYWKNLNQAYLFP